MKSTAIRRILIATLAGAALSGGLYPLAAAQAQEPARHGFDIPAQDVAAALEEFGRQSGKAVMFNRDRLTGARSRPVRGSYSADQALGRLLAGTGLTFRAASANAFVVELPAAQEISEAREEPPADIVVTGSRIERAGFDQPTPTTVIGATEMRQSASSNLQHILNDQPQVRASVIGANTVGNTNSGMAPVDLRGLGTDRTLTLLNGRRFVGQNNLNFVPLNMVERLEVVTGGASAAWGSGAVAGVVNIILKDDVEGISLGAETGISSRGDGQRYRFDGSFGTQFAGGSGHFMAGVEYNRDKGLPPRSRNDRKGVRGAGLTVIDGNLTLADDVNVDGRSYSGVITSGILAGQTFNNDGTLRPYRGPNAAGIGGEDASGFYDDIYLASPFERFNAYARASYDIGKATIWADATYGRVKSGYNFFPDLIAPGDFAGGPLTIQANNPFLSASIRNQLSAAGESSFTIGRTYRDILMFVFDSDRDNKEGAIGIDGTIGATWKYRAHYSHGELGEKQELQNSRLAGNFARAIEAVSNGGQIVCAVNADADPTNNDPACRPLNIFGEGNASAAAIDYVTGTQGSRATQKLDSAGVELQGTLFSTWAGPVTVAIGAEARWEELRSSRDIETMTGDFGLPVYTSDLNGGFSVKEAFGEAVAPLLDTKFVKLDVSAAARYSDYSTSGGIWSWKIGGSARILNDLRLRATRSRDIRSPSINDLFSLTNIGIGPVLDLDTAGREGIVTGYDPTPAQVTTIFGGNPQLKPEIGSTLTIGGSYAPSFFPRFNLSVDYYSIKISKAIASLGGSELTLACAQGSQAACDRVVRDPVTQTLLTVYSNAQNIANFQTSGFDFEASYSVPVSQIAGSEPANIRIRALATYVKELVSETGVSRVDTAGDVGDGVFGLPNWRGTLSVSYQDSVVGIDTRLRYVGGGKINHLFNGVDGPLLINNDVAPRMYVDLGVQFKVAKAFNVYGNVNNLLDRRPPITPTGSSNYDVTGRYFTVGARVNF